METSSLMETRAVIPADSQYLQTEIIYSAGTFNTIGLCAVDNFSQGDSRSPADIAKTAS
jgi:hypothetical protein